jgi:hypothetical protein
MLARAMRVPENGINQVNQKTLEGSPRVLTLSDRKTAGQAERCKTPEATALDKVNMIEKWLQNRTKLLPSSCLALAQPI